MQQALTEARPSPLTRGVELGGEPALIGRYQVRGRLGEGGMGVVYSAYDPELDRAVAIKLMFPDVDPERVLRSQEMLRREAQALAKLAHPNIVAIYDVGVHAGQVFVAMEFVVGRTMRQWWTERRPGWQEVLAALVQAGRGIVAAHALGLIHRDIKPDNLLIGDDGRVRVADFGIVRHDPLAAEHAATAAGGARELATITGRGLVGTPAYMPPEQHAGGVVGPHSDQFSFCVTLWEGLYGRRPFDDAWALPGVSRALVPTRPEGAPELPAWLDRAVRRGLAREVGERWPSMQALLDVLAVDFDARRARRNRRLTLGVLALVGCVALVLGVGALQAKWARDGRERAAALRLVDVRASVAGMLARDARAEAEETLRAFVQEPELRDTSAAIDAWLMWADYMDAVSDRPAAQTAVVEAYTALPEDDPREPAIALRIARQFRSAWNFDALAVLGEQVAARWPTASQGPDWSELRADAALARGDLAGFLALHDAGLVRSPRGELAPVLRRLATRRCPSQKPVDVLVADWPGSAGLELISTERDFFRYLPRPRTLRRMDLDLTPVGPELDASYFVGPTFRPLQRVPGGLDHLVAYDVEPKEISLHELRVDGLHEVLRWRDDGPSAVAAADLDGDGARELYVGTATYTRKLYRLEPDAHGVWQRRPAHPPTDAIHSDIRALVPGDFDADGREELAAAVSAWRAFEVRIFEAGPDGALQVVARHRFGNVTHMAALRAADGSTLLALAKDDTARSKEAWAQEAPQGDPAGVYVVRRRGAALEPVAYFPWVQRDPWGPPSSARMLHIGDFDADGRDDVAVGFHSESPHAELMLLHQRPDGTFANLVLGRLEPIHAGDFDGDPGDELLVMIKEGESAELCILGVDGDPVAGGALRHPTPELAELHDPLLARTWTRTENLAGFGLYGQAARSLEQALALTTHEADRRVLRRRAAEFYEAAGDAVRAGERFEALAAEGAPEAALRAVASFEQGLRMSDALRVARAALAAGGLTPEQESELRLARERLAPIERRDARVELRFDRPLDPGWQIHEPLALRVDPVHDHLVVEASADTNVIASLPIELTDGPLTIEFDVDIDRAEWGTQLSLALCTPEGELALQLLITAGGGGGYLRRQDVFGTFGQFSAWDTASPAERSAHRLRVVVFPFHQRALLEERGDHPVEARIVLPRAYRPGLHLLQLRSTNIPDFAGQQLRGRIRRIELLGARKASAPPATPPPPPRERLQYALVGGDWHAALAVPDDGSPEARLGRAVAFAELGRAAEATLAFASLDPQEAPIRRQLRHLLRNRAATYAPLLRAALARGYAALLLEALQKKGDYLDEEWDALRFAATVDIEGLPDADDRAAWLTRAGLLTVRGSVALSARKFERALADLGAAAALRERAAAEPDARDEARALLDLRLAEIAAQLGRLDDAAAAARRALLRSEEPDWMAERLRMSTLLAPLRADPRGSSVLGPP